MRFIDGKQIIELDKPALIETLTKNRDQHRAVFEEACEGYRKMATERIAAMLKDAKEGRQIAQYVGLTVPTDHTGDYNRVITALTMSVDSRCALTEQQFAQYVMDDWEWRKNFLTAAGSYSVTATSMYAAHYTS